MVSMMVLMTTLLRTMSGWRRQSISWLVASGRMELFGGMMRRSAEVQNEVVGTGSLVFQSSFRSLRKELPGAIWRVDSAG